MWREIKNDVKVGPTSGYVTKMTDDGIWDDREREESEVSNKSDPKYHFITTTPEVLKRRAEKSLDSEPRRSKRVKTNGARPPQQPYLDPTPATNSAGLVDNEESLVEKGSPLNSNHPIDVHPIDVLSSLNSTGVSDVIQDASFIPGRGESPSSLTPTSSQKPTGCLDNEDHQAARSPPRRMFMSHVEIVVRRGSVPSPIPQS